jgi:hypothetical protein
MSYGGWQEDARDALESKERKAMTSVIAEFNTLGLDITGEDLVDLMDRAGIVCQIEMGHSKVALGTFSLR